MILSDAQVFPCTSNSCCSFCRDARCEDHPGVCGHTHKRIFRLVVSQEGSCNLFLVISLFWSCRLARSAVLFRLGVLIRWKALDMSCGISWDSLKFELRAYAGLLHLLKRDWTNFWCPEKRMVLCVAHGTWVVSILSFNG